MIGNGLSTERDVHIIDKTTPPLVLPFSQPKGNPTTLSSVASIDDSEITIDATVNFTDGTLVGIFSGVSGEGRFYFGTQIGPPAGNVITLDTPIDFDFQIGDVVLPLSTDLAIDGSATPQVFSIQAGDVLDIHITRLSGTMTHATAGDLSKFGNIAALAKGIVIRRVDGTTQNIFNAKSNAELKTLCGGDLEFDTAQGGAPDGTSFRYTFNGPDKQGTTIALMAGDSLDLIIQDNLAGLTSFGILAQGHIKEQLSTVP